MISNILLREASIYFNITTKTSSCFIWGYRESDIYTFQDYIRSSPVDCSENILMKAL